jgi:uncharacterized protein with FMN-binding domain
MRRAPIAIIATVAGLAAVLGYHPHSRPPASVTAQSPPAASTPAPARSRASRPPATTGVRQVTGTDVPNQYGDVQVRLTSAGGRITKVTVLRLPSADGQSQQISSFAGPQLAQQTIAAQSANIDGVSGATYTSDSYRTSLQSAIDQLPSTTASTSNG